MVEWGGMVGGLGRPFPDRLLSRDLNKMRGCTRQVSSGRTLLYFLIFIYLFLKDFIYLFMRHTHTHTEREGGRDIGRGLSLIHI